MALPTLLNTQPSLLFPYSQLPVKRACKHACAERGEGAEASPSWKRMPGLFYAALATLPPEHTPLPRLALLKMEGIGVQGSRLGAGELRRYFRAIALPASGWGKRCRRRDLHAGTAKCLRCPAPVSNVGLQHRRPSLKTLRRRFLPLIRLRSTSTHLRAHTRTHKPQGRCGRTSALWSGT